MTKLNVLYISSAIIAVFFLGVIIYSTIHDGGDLTEVIKRFEWITMYILPWLIAFLLYKLVKKK
ncbi:hypothetical protein [Paenibacillus sp. L3-i20]|uniref:hypothetical protein n=1 Tax=Paenibacillus sp. L3-i20 TaxID=2905833 RepID=UPI001EDFA2FC|nr:hypothetical protein [Paenibacillus sp. L3-i20]GKU77509.1 hypothetical protein L3i20_v219060 [Paenibacillus sp. L3-i20]